MSLKIVIIGAGEVGFNLAKELCQENYDITIVDTNPKKIKHASETLDVSTIVGNGASPFILRQAQVDSADIFLALTRIDEVNLVACQMARELGAKTVITRLRNTEYTSDKAIIQPSRFGIDEVIHPELAVVEEVNRLLRQSSALDVKEFEGGRLQLVGIMLEASSPLLERTVEEVSQAKWRIPHLVVAIDREGKTFIPQTDSTYKVGDIVYILGESQNISSVLSMLGKPRREVNKIMILGAGKIGRRLATLAQHDLDVKLVDSNKIKAEEAAPALMNTLVLHGDGTDIDFLVSENIHEMDSFIAVTDDEQTNFLSGLLAKHLGAQQVIVHLDTTSYLPIARRIGIEAAISKNMVTVEAILRVIKSNSERTVTPFEDVELEALEVETDEGSKVTKKLLKDIDFPSGMILGAIIRGSAIEIPSGETQVLPGDRVLVFVQNEQVEKVQKYFT